MQFARLVPAGRAPLPEPVDETLRTPVDDLVPAGAQEGQDREADRQVAAQVAPVFNQHDAVLPARGRSLCSHQAGGTAADNQHVHVADFLQGNVSVGKLKDGGQGFQPTFCLLADGQNIAAVLHRSGGDGKHDLFNFVFFHKRGNVVAVAHDLDAPQIAAALVEIIIHNAQYIVDRLFAGLKFPQCNCASPSAAHQKRPLPGRDIPGPYNRPKQTVADSGCTDEGNQQNSADKRIADGEKGRDAYLVDDEFQDTDDGSRDNDVHELINAGKFP